MKIFSIILATLFFIFSKEQISDMNFLAESGLSADQRDNFMMRKSNLSSTRSYKPQENGHTPQKIQEFEKFGIPHNDLGNIDKSTELKNFDIWWQKKTAVKNDHVSGKDREIIDKMIDEGWKRKHVDTGAVINEYVLRTESELMDQRQKQIESQRIKLHSQKQSKPPSKLEQMRDFRKK